MFKLKVSYDCGMTCREEQTVERVDSLDNRCKKLDEQGYRWIVQDEQDRIVRVCKIHTDTLAFMYNAIAGLVKE